MSQTRLPPLQATAWARLVAAVLAVLSAQGAQADNPVSLTLSQTLTAETNVLRDDRDKRRDLVSQTAVVVGFDKVYGRQTYKASVQGVAERFKNSTNLDNDGYAISGSFSTEIGRNGLASISHRRNRELVAFEAQGLQRGKDITDGSSTSIDVRYGIGGWWSITGNHNRDKADYSLSEASERNGHSTRVGLRYNFTDLMYLDGGVRKGQTNYPKSVVFAQVPGAPTGITERSVGERYDRTDFNLQGGWQITGFSSLSGSVAWSDEKNTPDPFKDYSGLTWNINWGFSPRGKLSYSLALSRDTNDRAQSFESSFDTRFYQFNGLIADDQFVTGSQIQRSLITSLSGAVNWRATAKISARVSASISQIDSDIFVGFGGDSQLVQSSKGFYRNLSLSANYAPLNSLFLNCALNIYRRSATTTSLGYGGETATCSAAYVLD